MTTPEDLIQHFDHIRQTFFPRWEAGKGWCIVVADDLDGAQGKCNTELKQIQIVSHPKGDELTGLIIHESAHAVAGGDHGKRWMARMEKAAADAERMGMAGVANTLREQIAGYGDGFKPAPTTVYNELVDAVVHQPQMSFEQAVDFVRRGYGLSRDEFVRRFRRAAVVYDEARQYVEERARAKTAWAEESTA